MMKQHGPFLGMIYVQVSYAGMYLITRVALTHGMSHYVYVFYRQAVATLSITPFALFFESDQRSKLTLRNVGNISVLALLGVTISQNFYYAGLSLTSTTMATSMNNINPALTFVMAVALRYVRPNLHLSPLKGLRRHALQLVLRLEKLGLWTRRGQAKVWGTLLCVGGAMVMTLLKGPAIILLSKPSALTLPAGPGSSWVLGALLLAAGVWTWSACMIYQAWIVQDCPSQLTSTAVMCWSGTLQTALVALLFEEPGAWRLSWDLQLLTISYSGIFCSALGLFAQLWCVKERGPVFVSVFSPVSTVLVAILEPLLLHVPLHWGSLAGMVMVIGGLYCVLWGKAKDEEKMTTRLENTVDAGSREPLLTQNTDEQIEI